MHGDGLDRVEPHLGEAGDDLVGAEPGAGLEIVVDGDAAGADGKLARLEGEGGGEGHGVGATGARDEHQRGVRPFRKRRTPPARPGFGELGASGLFGVTVVFGDDVVEYAADRQAYRRDRRMGTHVRCPSG